MLGTWARVETSGNLYFLVELGLLQAGPSGEW